MSGGPYSADQGRSCTGESWPWGRPGELAPVDYPAGHQGGAAGMLDRVIEEERGMLQHQINRSILRDLHGSPEIEPYPFQVTGFHVLEPGQQREGRFTVLPAGTCPIPECTIPSPSDDDPCEAHA